MPDPGKVIVRTRTTSTRHAYALGAYLLASVLGLAWVTDTIPMAFLERMIGEQSAQFWAALILVAGFVGFVAALYAGRFPRFLETYRWELGANVYLAGAYGLYAVALRTSGAGVTIVVVAGLAVIAACRVVQVGLELHRIAREVRTARLDRTQP
jgi:hypothetical protein